MYCGLYAVDYKLLNFIKKNEPVDLDKLRSSLRRTDALETRVSRLKTELGYIYEESDSFVNNIGRVITNFKGTYRITENGIKALQDYRVKHRHDNLLLVARDCAIPITVSIIAEIAKVLINCVLK